MTLEPHAAVLWSDARNPGGLRFKINFRGIFGEEAVFQVRIFFGLSLESPVTGGGAVRAVLGTNGMRASQAVCNQPA